MDNVICFFQNKCIYDGWFEIIKITISLATIIFAFFKANDWIKELKGKHVFEVKNNLIHRLESLKDKIEGLEIIFFTFLDKDLPLIPEIEALKMEISQRSLQADPDIGELRKIIKEDKVWIPEIISTIQKIENIITGYFTLISRINFPRNPVDKTKERRDELITRRKKFYQEIISAIDTVIPLLIK